LKLNGIHQLLVYADVNKLGGGGGGKKKLPPQKKPREALVFANKEIGLEVNANKIKYMACLEI
jgi:hypothetical protein